MEGDFRHVCETKDKHRFSKQGVLLGGSEAMGVFMFSFMQFKHIQLQYALIWLLQWCPNGCRILALLRSFAG